MTVQGFGLGGRDAGTGDATGGLLAPGVCRESANVLGFTE